MKRFIIAFIVAYVFIFAWGWLLNGVLLKDVYAQTPILWRSQSEMMSLFHWILIGQALVIFAFVMIYACGSLAAAWLPESGLASCWKLQRLACDWPFTQPSRSPEN